MIEGNTCDIFLIFQYRSQQITLCLQRITIHSHWSTVVPTQQVDGEEVIPFFLNFFLIATLQ